MIDYVDTVLLEVLRTVLDSATLAVKLDFVESFAEAVAATETRWTR